jgi:hypothetical protein
MQGRREGRPRSKQIQQRKRRSMEEIEKTQHTPRGIGRHELLEIRESGQREGFGGSSQVHRVRCNGTTMRGSSGMEHTGSGTHNP